MEEKALHDVILNHRSIRRFTQKPVPQAVLEDIVACAQLAPSSCFYQAYTIIRITDNDTRNALYAISGNQSCLLSAAEILVFCADFHRGVSHYENIDPAVVENTEYYTVAVIDAALAGQNALVAAESMGLGTVMVGGIRNDVAAVARRLNLPNLVMPLFALCLGYYDDPSAQKPRLPMAAVLRENTYDGADNKKAIDEYNAVNEEYYQAREGKPDRWTHRCGKSIMQETRDDFGTYAKSHGFLQRD